jgi:hypothetical protein
MLAGQPAHDTLEQRRARFDLRAHGEPPMNGVAVTTGGEHRLDIVGWMDPVAVPEAPSTGTHDIRVDESHRILVASGSHDRPGTRAWLIPAALAGSIGLASIGVLGGSSFFTTHTASSTAPLQNTSPPSDIANSNKGDRLPIHWTATRETAREAPASAPHPPKPSPSIASARPKPPAAAQPPAPSTMDSAVKPSMQMPLAPVPETRPTTIDGWTLREVVDGTAVLEGPGGVLRVRRGDSVPGVGKVVGILRWGNRLIVATSKGLISTP